MISMYFALIDNDDDKDKFLKIYNQYDALLHTIAYNILKDQHRSEDAVQECYMRLINCLHKINNPICPQTKSFVVIIVRNISIDIYRELKKERSIFLENIEEIPDPSEKFNFDSEDLQKLIDSIRELPDIYKDIVYLRYNHDCTNHDISRILNIPYNTVVKRFMRLKKIIEEKKSAIL